MVTATTLIEPTSPVFTPNLIGLDEKIHSQLLGCALTTTKYKQGIQFDLKAGNDIVVQTDCTIVDYDILVKVDLVYQGHAISLDRFSIESRNQQQVKEELEHNLLLSLSIIFHIKDDELAQDMRSEENLDTRQILLQQFKDNIELATNDHPRNPSLPELQHRVKQIKIF